MAAGDQEVANFLTLCERVLHYCANRVNARVRDPTWQSVGGTDNPLCQFAPEQRNKDDTKSRCLLAPYYTRSSELLKRDSRVGQLLVNALRKDCGVKVRVAISFAGWFSEWKAKKRTRHVRPQSSVCLRSSSCVTPSRACLETLLRTRTPTMSLAPTQANEWK
jgi:hypothetical protein